MNYFFDVTREPRTATEIQKARKRVIRQWVGEALVAAMLVYGGYQFLNQCTKDPGIYVLPTIVAFIMCFFRCCWLGGDLRCFDDLPQDRCADFDKNCRETPEGSAYRVAVLNQSRKFTKGEDDAMAQWAYQKDDRAACKKLYEVPTNSSALASTTP